MDVKESITNDVYEYLRCHGISTEYLQDLRWMDYKEIPNDIANILKQRDRTLKINKIKKNYGNEI